MKLSQKCHYTMYAMDEIGLYFAINYPCSTVIISPCDTLQTIDIGAKICASSKNSGRTQSPFIKFFSGNPSPLVPLNLTTGCKCKALHHNGAPWQHCVRSFSNRVRYTAFICDQCVFDNSDMDCCNCVIVYTLLGWFAWWYVQKNLIKFSVCLFLK